MTKSFRFSFQKIHKKVFLCIFENREDLSIDVSNTTVSSINNNVKLYFVMLHFIVE